MLTSFPTALQPSPAMIVVFTIAGALTLLLLIRRVVTYWQVYWRNLGEETVETELEAPESRNRITGHARSSAGTRSGVTIVL